MIFASFQAAGQASPKKGTRLFLAALPVTMTLVYPVCAAICPKGRSGCPFPGRCFLFTDADGNSFCDYTSAFTASSARQSPLGVPPQNPSVILDPAGQQTLSAMSTAHAGPSVSPTYIPSLVPDSSLFQSTGLLHVHPLALGALVFIIVFAVFMLLSRYGITDFSVHRNKSSILVPASFAFGIAGLVTWALVPETVPVLYFVLAYILNGMLLAAYLLISGRMTRILATSLIVMSIVAGFVYGAPLMPLMVPDLSGVVITAKALSPGIVAVITIGAVTFLVGRVFCAYLCPVGSVQELASRATKRKVYAGPPMFSETIRFVFCVTALAGGGYYAYWITLTGISSFFQLAMSAGFFAFAGIIVVSAVIYRPVCRFICPFGTLFSIPAHACRMRLTRTGSCIDCGRCEKVCPVGVAGRGASKRECYMCGRCQGACRTGGALVYQKKQ